MKFWLLEKSHRPSRLRVNYKIVGDGQATTGFAERSPSHIFALQCVKMKVNVTKAYSFKCSIIHIVLRNLPAQCKSVTLKGLEQPKLVLNILSFPRRNISMSKWRKQTPRAPRKSGAERRVLPLSIFQNNISWGISEWYWFTRKKIMSEAMQKERATKAKEQCIKKQM